jgi:subtilisin family serine protease
MGRTYGDAAGHGQELRTAASDVVAEHAARRDDLGVDPRLILVLETTRALEVGDLRPAELMLLDNSAGRAVVAFAEDPALTEFAARIDRYSRGPEQGRREASFTSLFDAIVDVRRYGPVDRISQRLADFMAENDGVASDVLLDAECWFPSTTAQANEWLDEVSTTVRLLGGEPVSRYLNSAVGLALVRVRVPADRIEELANLDVLASLDLMPVPTLLWSQIADLSADDLPDLPEAPGDAPVVGVIDSGVRSAHPLLAGYVDAADSVAGLSDGQDRHGHGTAVAALILHADLGESLATGEFPRPLCRVYSVRVLDDHNEFPGDRLLVEEIAEALQLCAERGIRVVNLSIGDRDAVFGGGRTTALATELDHLARELGLVLIVSTGNVFVADYCLPDRADAVTEYPSLLLSSPLTRLIDPAPSALALTVGGTVHATTTLDPSRRPMGAVGWPAPYTRRGPGVGGAIKPELCAPAGTWATNGSIYIDDVHLGRLSADGQPGSSRLAYAFFGTSFAAPSVARVAAGVVGRHSGFGANLVRALILQSAESAGFEYLPSEPGVGDGTRAQRARTLAGYGEPDVGRAIGSTSHRAVLVAEDNIEADGVHLYEVPIPSSFFESGGVRGITVALSFDPQVRAHRADYLSARLKFEVLRGVEMTLATELLLASDEDEVEAEDADGSESPHRLSDLGTRRRLVMAPAVTERSRGTNQLARKEFKQRLRPEDGESFLLAVQSTNRWQTKGTKQPYAVAVTLWRSVNHAEVYSELSAEMEAVETETTVEVEV